MGPQIAWIGLGNMGRGMTANLVSSGNLDKPLILYNRTKKRADDLSAKLGTSKSTAASSIAEVVQKADIIFTCLGTDAAVESTIEECLAQTPSGKLFVDCSTIHPNTSRALGKKITQSGNAFVSSPVYGAPPIADAGKLIFVLAGPKEAVAKVKPYTKGVMGRAVIEVGEDYGLATTLKLTGNTLIMNMVESLAEAHTLAEKTGVGSQHLHEVVEALFGEPYAAYSTRQRTGDYHKRDEPLFNANLAIKDIGHAMHLAEENGTSLPQLEVMKKRLQRLKEHDGEKADVAGVYGAARLEAGMAFEVD